MKPLPHRLGWVLNGQWFQSGSLIFGSWFWPPLSKWPSVLPSNLLQLKLFIDWLKSKLMTRGNTAFCHFWSSLCKIFSASSLSHDEMYIFPASCLITNRTSSGFWLIDRTKINDQKSAIALAGLSKTFKAQITHTVCRCHSIRWTQTLGHMCPRWTYADQAEEHLTDTRPEADPHKEVRAELGEWFKFKVMAVCVCVCAGKCSSNCSGIR